MSHAPWSLALELIHARHPTLFLDEPYTQHSGVAVGDDEGFAFASNSTRYPEALRLKYLFVYWATGPQRLENVVFKAMLIVSQVQKPVEGRDMGS